MSDRCPDNDGRPDHLLSPPQGSDCRRELWCRERLCKRFDDEIYAAAILKKALFARNIRRSDGSSSAALVFHARLRSVRIRSRGVRCEQNASEITDEIPFGMPVRKADAHASVCPAVRAPAADVGWHGASIPDLPRRVFLPSLRVSSPTCRNNVPGQTDRRSHRARTAASNNQFRY